jgi:hypothetical protein
MKKIPISNFRKKFDDASFQVVKKCISKRSDHGTQTVNISKIIDEINDLEVKKKFVTWASGYDFAVIDI